MPDKSGQTFEIPKSNPKLTAEVITSLTDCSNTNHEKVMEIPLSNIDPFPNHPFQVKQDEAMKAMVESVKTFGI
jgi:ParB family chromosome partitioning protein